MKRNARSDRKKKKKKKEETKIIEIHIEKREKKRKNTCFRLYVYFRISA